MILSETWEGSFYVCLTEPPGFIPGEHQNRKSTSIMDLYEADGDYQLADKICREEFGIKNGLEGSYNSIYDINLDTKIIQTLVPYLDYNWIKSIKYTKNKVA